MVNMETALLWNEDSSLGLGHHNHEKVIAIDIFYPINE